MVKTKVIKITPVFPAFKDENLLILLDPAASSELKKISAIHDVDQPPEKQ